MTKLKEVYEKDFGDKIKEEKLKELKENQKVAQEQKENKKEKYSRQAVNVTGLDNILTRLAKCCNPIPGDDIVGYITKDRGVTIHRSDCKNVQRDLKNSQKDLIEVHWNNENKNGIFDVQVQIRAYDRRGLFSDISRVFEDDKIDMISLSARKQKDNIAILDVTFEVKTNDQMKKMIKKLKQVQDVQEVYRISK